MDYETCRSNLEQLVRSEGNSGRNEATTRLHLIDRILFDCLSWDRQDANLEDSYSNEYADYTFSISGTKSMIVEAKREGPLFDLPAGTNSLVRSLRPLLRDNKPLAEAVKQVAQYCQARGVELAVVTDGHQILAFLGARTDGISPLESNALVFLSLDSVLSHFLSLWQALSKPGVLQRKLKLMLQGPTPNELPLKLSSTISSYPGLKQRNPFQTDLQVLSEFILEDIVTSKDLEPRFLSECYAQSGALSQYSLLSRDILQARYAALFQESENLKTTPPTVAPANTAKGLSPELIAESLSRRPIVLLGDTGVGKTTFIRRLIRIDAEKQFSNAITLSIDFGSQATLTSSLRDVVLDNIERQLLENYRIDILENDFVRNVYYSEIHRFQRGVFSPLRQSDPEKYGAEELRVLENLLSKRDGHLARSIEHIQKARKKQIILILDNADQRDYETQQQVFLIAQEVAEHWPVTVFIALRPETFHRSLRSGALSGYHARAFTISPPRTDNLLELRLNFAIRLTQGEFPIPNLSGRTTLDSRSLNRLLKIFTYSIRRNKNIVEFIDNTCGGNMRLALTMVRGFLGSGHVDTEKILSRYESSGSYLVPLHEFVRAVLFGDTIYYDPTRSNIVNLFDVSGSDVREHFALPILLSSLEALSGAGSSGGYRTLASVYEYAQQIGFQPDQIEATIERGVSARLIEQSPGRFTDFDIANIHSLRTTSAGAYHLRRLVHMFTYLDAVVIDTPIFDREVRSQIVDASGIDERLSRGEIFLSYLDKCWTELNSTGDTFDWSSVSTVVKNDIQSIRDRIKRAQRYIAS